MPIDRETVVRVMFRERLRLMAYIVSITRDRQHAEDIYQDISVAALGEADNLNDEQHLRAWVRNRARFRSIDHVRRSASRPLVFSSELIDKLDADWLARQHEVTSERMDLLRECLEELPAHARKIIQLRYQDGHTGKELADLMNRTTNAIYLAVSRIHKSLRLCVEERASRREGGVS